MMINIGRALHMLAATVALVSAASVPVTSGAAYAAKRADTAEKSLIAVEDGLLQAKITRDTATIARSMADELIYTHAAGRVQSKADYLKSVADGGIAYRSITTLDRTAHVSGNLGVTHGQIKMTVGNRELKDSYLATYVKRDGRWQLLYWQTSPGQ